MTPKMYHDKDGELLIDMQMLRTGFGKTGSKEENSNEEKEKTHD